jgi:hypothetical protein
MRRRLEQMGVRAGMIYVALLAIMNAGALGLRATPGYAPTSDASEAIASAIGLGRYPLHAEIIFRLLIAVIGGAAWWAYDRGRRDERELRDVFFLEVRFVLAAALISAGLGQLLGVTTPWPSEADWIRPMREMDPQSFLTAWIGSSSLHKISLGIVDVAAGVCLLYRRMMLLGAFTALGAIGNVVMTQISFEDVRVGVYWPSIELSAMALVLVLGDLRRILDAIFNEKTFVPGVAPAPALHTPLLQRFARIARPVAFVVIALANVPILLRAIDVRRHSPIAGVYRVERYTLNGQEDRSDRDDPGRWRLVAIDDCSRFAIRTMDDRQLEGAVSLPDARKTNRGQLCQELTSKQQGMLTLVPPDSLPISVVSPGLSGSVKYNRTEPDVLEIEGKLGNDVVIARLRRLPNTAFRVFVRFQAYV